LQQKFHNIFKVYDSNGELVFSFGSNGEGNGQFNAPTGVAVDSQVKRSLSD
jgi:tripartite motif-containing protein 2/3